MTCFPSHDFVMGGAFLRAVCGGGGVCRGGLNDLLSHHDFVLDGAPRHRGGGRKDNRRSLGCVRDDNVSFSMKLDLCGLEF